MSKIDLFKADCMTREIVLKCEENRYRYYLKEKDNNKKQELYTWALAASNFALTSININSNFFINNGYDYKKIFVVGTIFGLATATLTSINNQKKDKRLTKKLERVKKDYLKASSSYEQRFKK